MSKCVIKIECWYQNLKLLFLETIILSSPMLFKSCICDEESRALIESDSHRYAIKITYEINSGCIDIHRRGATALLPYVEICTVLELMIL